MTTYQDWNRAILEYVTGGQPVGSHIYLSIDEDALTEIGNELGIAEARKDFLAAVRHHCLMNGRVTISRLHLQNNDDLLLCVGFLATMVLAAHEMSEDEEISSANYFTRLNQILGFGDESDRPPGLNTGDEEPLWQQWNNYLRHKGYIPTAKPGPDGPHRYIRYPISQALLREADKEHLWRHFGNRNWPTYLDEDLVTARIRRDVEMLNRHLYDLLHDENLSRREAASQAIFDVYDDWRTVGGVSRSRRQRHHRRKQLFSAGIYREFDPFLGTCTYFLLPKSRRSQLQPATLHYNGSSQPLKPDHNGQIPPLFALSAKELTQGLSATIQIGTETQPFDLPARNFWILVPEPDFPESGIYGSWGRPELGQSFVLLCRESLQDDMGLLRDEGLIRWQTVAALNEYPGWLEYRGLMVVSEAWTGVHIENTDLYESLRPHATVGISLRGGLRLPHSSSWLVSYGPEIIVRSFHSMVEMTVWDLSHDQVVRSHVIPRDEPISFAWAKPGDYQVEITAGGQTSDRFVKIISWEEVKVVPLPDITPLAIGTGQIQGAWIME